MTHAALVALAFDAVNSHASRLVFADTLEDAAWWDERLPTMRWDRSSYSSPNFRGVTQENLGRRLKHAGRQLCRAIGALLLFGDWTTKRWPGNDDAPEPGVRRVPGVNMEAFFGMMNDRYASADAQATSSLWAAMVVGGRSLAESPIEPPSYSDAYDYLHRVPYFPAAPAFMRYVVNAEPGTPSISSGASPVPAPTKDPGNLV